MTVHSSPDRPDRDRAGGDKRARILTAAERIFARHGFFAARVSEIAKEAGVADGTIYLYFKSKDDLLISLFESRMKQVNDSLRAAIADRSPIEQLRAFIHA
ncbi:MAG TPA: helix-turn-helix domain-containing protein, partial [Kofleriaceae bacterium]|nr:helix-turn-helix domain-containing protein [Kofleriaceae bacterium]